MITTAGWYRFVWIFTDVGVPRRSRSTTLPSRLPISAVCSTSGSRPSRSAACRWATSPSRSRSGRPPGREHDPWVSAAARGDGAEPTARRPRARPRPHPRPRELRRCRVPVPVPVAVAVAVAGTGKGRGHRPPPRAWPIPPRPAGWELPPGEGRPPAPARPHRSTAASWPPGSPPERFRRPAHSAHTPGGRRRAPSRARGDGSAGDASSRAGWAPRSSCRQSKPSRRTPLLSLSSCSARWS